jgi:hypothetical protein
LAMADNSDRARLESGAGGRAITPPGPAQRAQVDLPEQPGLDGSNCTSKFDVGVI